MADEKATVESVLVYADGRQVRAEVSKKELGFSTQYKGADDTRPVIFDWNREENGVPVFHEQANADYHNELARGLRRPAS